MKKRYFAKYIILILFLFLAASAVQTLFFRAYLTRADLDRRKATLEDGADDIRREISMMMELTQQDYQYLLENESGHLSEVLEGHRSSDEEMELMMTDRAGQVLIEAPEAAKDALSDLAVTDLTEKAREGGTFVTDLDGFFTEERLCRAVVLEKEHSDTLRQRVGLVILSLPAKGESNLSTALLGGLFTGLLITAALLLLFVLLVEWKLLRPLRQLDRVAEAFAKGDFSKRLPEKGTGGLTPLFRAFNQMAETVEKNETVRQTFVSNVSHDLRTPLTTISGFVQNMLHGAIPPERLAHYYKIILDEVNRLSRLVQTLLETSRMTAGERKYYFDTVELCELGRLTLLSFEKRLEEKHIDVIFFSSQDALFVEADRDAIQQVIYNLLDNAVKFTPEGGKLSMEITHREKKAFFAVSNSGEGIPEEELTHLFDRFYKSDRSRGLDKKGMGLGLFIAKSVIDAHGEELWVESKEGSYTQFVFTLPLSRQGKKKNPQ